MLPDQASIPSFAEIFSEEKIVNVFEVNLQHCLEESGQWLENVVRASGKLVLQKSHVIMAYECAATSLDYYQKEI